LAARIDGAVSKGPGFGPGAARDLGPGDQMDNGSRPDRAGARRSSWYEAMLWAW